MVLCDLPLHRIVIFFLREDSVFLIKVRRDRIQPLDLLSGLLVFFSQAAVVLLAFGQLHVQRINLFRKLVDLRVLRSVLSFELLDLQLELLDLLLAVVPVDRRFAVPFVRYEDVRGLWLVRPALARHRIYNFKVSVRRFQLFRSTHPSSVRTFAVEDKRLVLPLLFHRRLLSRRSEEGIERLDKRLVHGHVHKGTVLVRVLSGVDAHKVLVDGLDPVLLPAVGRVQIRALVLPTVDGQVVPPEAVNELVRVTLSCCCCSSGRTSGSRRVWSPC